MTDEKKKKNILLYNVLFAAVCGGLLFFLLSAPPETTAHLPNDSSHKLFMSMDKKQAESHCGECHGTEKQPLPAAHPRPYRCLFCHKRT